MSDNESEYDDFFNAIDDIDFDRQVDTLESIQDENEDLNDELDITSNRRWKRKKFETTDAARKTKKTDEGDEREDQQVVFELTSKGWEFNFGPPPSQDQIQEDAVVRFLRGMKDTDEKSGTSDKRIEERESTTNAWRYGPAQYWHDLYNVPETEDGYEQWFKIKQQQHKEKKEESMTEQTTLIRETDSSLVLIPDDAFLMVTQMKWEDDIIMSSDDAKLKMLERSKKSNFVSWVPKPDNEQQDDIMSSEDAKSKMLERSKKSNFMSRVPTPDYEPSIPITDAKSFMPATKKITIPEDGLVESPYSRSDENLSQENIWWSIFPAENDELVQNAWEDDIIWDIESMDIPKPKIVTLDMNDEDTIIEIPDDVEPTTTEHSEGPPVKTKIPHPHVKKSKIFLGRSGIIKVLEEETLPPPNEDDDKDPFNISNDEYYHPKISHTNLKTSTVVQLIQHSTPMVELWPQLAPTNLNFEKQKFHRPLLERVLDGPLSTTNFHQIQPLLRHINKIAETREKERSVAGGGNIFYMRTLKDLSGKDGEILFMEYCEEHPPILSQVGMCTHIKNYYKPRAGAEDGVDLEPQDLPYGDPLVAHTSPFLGTLQPGQCISAIENNMYRAPIYPHAKVPSDFLVIRTRNGYFIRNYDALYTVGQECPLYEVFGPNSKKANSFIRDFLQVYIFRLFWKSRDKPKRIKMDDVKKAFPLHSECSIRKRLKLCAEFKRTGENSNWWVLKKEFRLPTEEELRAMVSPEQFCAFYSMAAAGKRLTEAGYDEKLMLLQNDDDDEEIELKMYDEVKVAPWNTTKAYLHAMKNKCLLQLNGPADPTGCGEGFSYIRVSNKPMINKDEVGQQTKRRVTGTDGDLRKLPLKKAREICRSFGVPEEEIMKRKRWEIIDLVRTLNTEKSKAGEECMDKFSRGNRFSIAEHQERYKEECQRIFDLQNHTLASEEVLSTDEEDSSEDDISKYEEIGKNVGNMIMNKKSRNQISDEGEEEVRKAFQQMVSGDSKDDKDTGDEVGMDLRDKPNQVLKITRTFKTENGHEFVRSEIVKNPTVIKAYLKIRKTKDDSFIRQLVAPSESANKREKKKNKKLHAQPRQERRKMNLVVRKPIEDLEKPNSDPNAKCSCGKTGRWKKSKICPLHHHAEKQPISDLAEERPIQKKVTVEKNTRLISAEGRKASPDKVRKFEREDTKKAIKRKRSTNGSMVPMSDVMEENVALNEDEELVNPKAKKVKLSKIQKSRLPPKVPKEAIQDHNHYGGRLGKDYSRGEKNLTSRKENESFKAPVQNFCNPGVLNDGESTPSLFDEVEMQTIENHDQSDSDKELSSLNVPQDDEDDDGLYF